MKDAPAYDWYPERFWFAVEGWTDREIVAYKRLLDQQWLRDGLPDDARALAGLARGKVPEKVLAKFPIETDGLRRNPFLETIRKSQRERIAKRREGAAITNAKRHAQRTLSDTLAPKNGANVGIASDTPPPTTHPIPPTEVSHPVPPRRRSANTPPPHPGPASPEYRKALEDWWRYKRERGQVYRPQGWNGLIVKLGEYPEATAIKAIQDAIANNWAGVFPERTASAAATKPTPELTSRPWDKGTQ